MDTSTLLHKKFKLPAGCKDETGKAIASVVMRETNGYDEQNAAKLADGQGKDGNFLRELMTLSIVKVNDVPAMQPFIGFSGWNSRARACVSKAFDALNEIPRDVDFLSGAEDMTPAPTTGQ